MEGHQTKSLFTSKIASSIVEFPFMLIDIGCGGGLDPVWREFGPSLRAIGFEPNVMECRRLAEAETHQGVRYEAAFVGIPPDHPFLAKKATTVSVPMNHWQRSSAFRSLEIKRAQLEAEGKPVNPYRYDGDDLTDQDRPVFLPDYIRDNKINYIDFVKIDVDGADYDILVSLGDVISSCNILGMYLEVNYVGSASEVEHTFHNTDRFMRKNGFQLFDLTVRRYSAAALPARYLITVPAQGGFGRPLQGDALYVRDILSPEYEARRDDYDEATILKLASIFSLFNIPDHAAEILIAFRSRLERVVDVASLLDVLARQAQAGQPEVLNYREYLDAFERDDPMFYPR